MDQLLQHMESLIFVTESPISLDEMQECLEASLESKFEPDELAAALQTLRERYQDASYAIEIVEIAKGYQFMTKGAFHHTVATYLKQTTRKRLSQAALETLSIVAYKQPVSKSDLERIRGVSCDYSLQKLLEKELVTIVGRSDGPGRPLLYATSEKFMDYFGLKSMKDLPQPKDFKLPDSEIGEQAPIEEDAAEEE
ncbi:MAG: SMC-Scp complex subunit ScpB [Saprospiraceae bacterium]|nr:SMC-Scp complex subunit ScpB [Saprospiraceae bacterium]MCB0680122.1 SMC-Scp complex subunit ScpB [Saprospiraceae bacterium]